MEVAGRLGRCAYRPVGFVHGLDPLDYIGEVFCKLFCSLGVYSHVFSHLYWWWLNILMTKEEIFAESSPLKLSG